MLVQSSCKDLRYGFQEESIANVKRSQSTSGSQVKFGFIVEYCLSLVMIGRLSEFSRSKFSANPVLTFLTFLTSLTIF